MGPLVDADGNKVVDYIYDPYGNTIADAAVSNPFQYTGRENDGTGLYYYRARYYSPLLARFMSSDPIGLNGGINHYAYVGGNPISSTDPSGLTQCDIDAAFKLAKTMNKEIYFGEAPPVPDMPRAGKMAEASLRNQGTRTNIAGRDGRIHLNKLYLDTLSDSTALDLYDSIVHEGLHFTGPMNLQVPKMDYDHDYIRPETARRVGKQGGKYLGAREKLCGCAK